MSEKELTPEQKKIKDLEDQIKKLKNDKSSDIQKMVVREVPEQVVNIVIKMLSETPTGNFSWVDVNNAIAMLQQSKQREVIITPDGGEPKNRELTKEEQEELKKRTEKLVQEKLEKNKKRVEDKANKVTPISDKKVG